MAGQPDPLTLPGLARPRLTVIRLRKAYDDCQPCTVIDYNQIAELARLVPGEQDLAFGGGAHCGALGRGEIDAVVIIAGPAARGKCAAHISRQLARRNADAAVLS